MKSEESTFILRRDCPKCGREGMAAASVCGFCWEKLMPLPADSILIKHIAKPFIDHEHKPISPEMQHYRNAPRRKCPSCGNEGMAAASVCGFCWTKLTPVVANTHEIAA